MPQRMKWIRSTLTTVGLHELQQLLTETEQKVLDLVTLLVI